MMSLTCDTGNSYVRNLIQSSNITAGQTLTSATLGISTVVVLGHLLVNSPSQMVSRYNRILGLQVVITIIESTLLKTPTRFLVQVMELTVSTTRLAVLT
jgi:hypothetical protein